jgi:hypothetical protein
MEQLVARNVAQPPAAGKAYSGLLVGKWDEFPPYRTTEQIITGRVRCFLRRINMTVARQTFS